MDKVEKQLNLGDHRKKIVKVLYISGQENFDVSNLGADIIFSRPYNGHCSLPDGLTYPEAFANGPIITWS